MTQEQNTTVIGNAISSYFLVFACIFFLWSKNPNINHPFVRNHVRVAFSLQMLLLLVLFVMSFRILEGFHVFGYSLNTIVTMTLCMVIFAGILYGIFKAHSGESITLGEVFQKTGQHKQVLKHTETPDMSEEENSLLITAQIPFLGYIISPRHSDIALMRDVSQLNLVTTLSATIFFLTGHSSFASLVMLVYTIWCVAQSLRLTFHGEITTLDMSRVPTPTEKYLMLRAGFVYLKNMLSKNTFVPFQTLLDNQVEKRKQQEIVDQKILDPLPTSPIVSWMFYIPFINIIGLGFGKTKDKILIRNGLVITIICGIIIGVQGTQSDMLTCMLFPVFYGIGYMYQKTYRMPFIYDIYNIFASFFHLFHHSKKLHQTKKTASFTPKEQEKEVTQTNQKQET